jgi:hypothetical protein
MTSATSFYPQSSSQPAGYQPTQVSSPRGSSSQPSAGYLPLQDYSPRGYSQASAGYQQQTQEYTSSNYRVPRAASVADTGVSAAGVPVSQPPIVEQTGGYVLFPPWASGGTDPTAKSAGSQYSTQPKDPYYDHGM